MRSLSFPLVYILGLDIKWVRRREITAIISLPLYPNAALDVLC